MPTREQRAKELNVRVDELPDGRGKHGHHRRGSNHPRWNDDIRSSHGYKLIRVGRDHPLSSPGGYAYEHLLVWVSANNPRPKKGQSIHHINGDSRDNRIEILTLMKIGDHNAHHLRSRKRDERGRFLPTKRP